MLARPLFREKHSPDMSEAEALELMREALKVTTYCMYAKIQYCLCFVIACLLALVCAAQATILSATD